MNLNEHFQEYRKRELALWLQLERYMEMNKANYERPLGGIEDNMSWRSSIYLPANNTHARIEFARVMKGALEEIAQQVTDEGLKLSFVTLSPGQFAMPEAEAHMLPRRDLKKLVRRYLKGFDYLGIIEGALFPREGNPDHPRRGTVSWHVHLIAWTKGREDLEAAVARFNAEHSSFLRGVKPGHVQRISTHTLPKKMFYALKSPTKQYVIGIQAGQAADPETGELLTVYRDKSNKSDLRTGQSLRMRNAQRGQQLDRLLVAGGRGKDLRATVREQALRKFNER